MSLTNDLISIIIPIYNRQDVIEECVASVLAQSYQNFEIIIVDDGSSDRTYEVCQALAESDARIRLFSAEHQGVSAARNKALDEAEGEYVFFLDSDDVIHPFLLETLVSGMKETDAAVGGTEVVNVRKSIWHKVAEKCAAADGVGETSFHTDAEVIDAMLGGSSPFSCIGGVMMRRDLIGNTRFRTDIYIGEDFAFIYDNVIKGASGVFLKQKWYYVRLHDHNSSWDYSYRGFWTRFYRRKLVWESEEAFGRKNYAIKQKRSAFDCFLVCIEKNKPYSKDSKEMRTVLRDYKKELFPALTFKSKIAYLLHLYLPATTTLLFKAKKRIVKWLRKMKKRAV